MTKTAQMNVEFDGFRKLNEYLDRVKDADIFDDHGIDLLMDGLKDIEHRGVSTIIAAGKPSLQDKIDKAVVFDIFSQGMTLIQKTNFIRGVLMIIGNENIFIDDPVKCMILHKFTAEKITDILNAEEGLCKLMRSILHTMKNNKSDHN